MIRKFPGVIILCVCIFFVADVSGMNSLSYAEISKRNIFFPLWRNSVKSLDDIEKDRKREEEQRKSEQEQRMAELRQQEESQRQETIKNQILNSLVLTGFVDDGKQSVAFIQNKRQGNKSLLLKEGDLIDDSMIVAIDQAGGKVILEHKSKIRVTLELNK
ncbi:MAG: hypothetical protein A2204_00125 [Elusimicrobia bacterium RIFOXYA1_FULL_47_7]|nr:MAG: hypothetical protein A2204_00125 [Elusimicrobia bacterium RIFOXYA1_FULL_47_7]OGS15747.1 MAG: hypothetical protein A2251_08675 [Elusimicrobia bacterium RIFOXYA2_FULL_47_53]OGS31048.1 MAG: hypothetical protein A2323_06995 [Elusimicrobia bacterium RIFOXYB2_FULL_46_23]